MKYLRLLSLLLVLSIFKAEAQSIDDCVKGINHLLKTANPNMVNEYERYWELSYIKVKANTKFKGLAYSCQRVYSINFDEAKIEKVDRALLNEGYFIIIRLDDYTKGQRIVYDEYCVYNDGTQSTNYNNSVLEVTYEFLTDKDRELAFTLMKRLKMLIVEKYNR